METVKDILECIDIDKITQGIKFYEGRYSNGCLVAGSFNFRTDFIEDARGYGKTLEFIDVVSDEELLSRNIENYEIMDCDRYDETILAKKRFYADDLGWKKKDRILVILLEPPITEREENYYVLTKKHKILTK